MKLATNSQRSYSPLSTTATNYYLPIRGFPPAWSGATTWGAARMGEGLG